MNNDYELYNGDCLKIMDELIERGIKVDAIITDPPYGTTQCKWDIIIPFDEMWTRLEKLIKPNGAIVLFGSEPFSSHLRMSNIKNFKYDWIWEKSKGNNFTHAKNMPIKFHEIISVFSYASVGHRVQLGDRRMEYNPQGLIKVDKVWKRPRKYDSEHKLKRESHKLERVIEFENYPKSVIKFTNSNNNERGLHPTQKPVALMEYLVKTYTSENDIVLDFTMGSGSTGVACMNTNRRFIGIELEKRYFDIARERMENTIVEKEFDDTNVI